MSFFVATIAEKDLQMNEEIVIILMMIKSKLIIKLKSKTILKYKKKVIANATLSLILTNGNNIINNSKILSTILISLSQQLPND